MLRQKTATGVLWNFLQQLSQRGIGILVTLILAHFLVPADFGLMAMLSVFITVAGSLMESGFKQALIRKKDALQKDFNAAFYANIFLGLLSYGLLFIIAPAVAAFYNEPRLTDLIRAVGVSIPITSFQVVQIANLSRSLNFKTQLKATVPATIASGFIAISLAYFGFGVWALVAQTLMVSALTTLILWAMRLWQPTLEFSQQSLSSMLGFGYKLFLSDLLNIVFKNLYIVVIAKLFSAPVAGFYFFAEKIKDLIINQLVLSIMTVTYPALATIQDKDARLKTALRNVIQVTTFLLFPAMLFLAALAEPLFHVVLPDTWLPAAVYLQLMCIAALLYPLHSINLNILKIKGRSDLFLYISIIKKLITFLILLISLPHGVIGILIGQIAASILSYIPNSYYSVKLINYSVREQLADILPGLFLSVFIAGVIYGAIELSVFATLLQLLVFSGIALTSYLLGAHLFRLNALQLAMALYRERLGRINT
ncbi:MAG: lipopolysaccharide biosynthesis protein [Nitrococcus mobilis]|nr:lipopolysaccharide biosynthesis protein [Nitrococcus mobilis]